MKPPYQADSRVIFNFTLIKQVKMGYEIYQIKFVLQNTSDNTDRRV